MMQVRVLVPVHQTQNSILLQIQIQTPHPPAQGSEKLQGHQIRQTPPHWLEQAMVLAQVMVLAQRQILHLPELAMRQEQQEQQREQERQQERQQERHQQPHHQHPPYLGQRS